MNCTVFGFRSKVMMDDDRSQPLSLWRVRPAHRPPAAQSAFLSEHSEPNEKPDLGEIDRSSVVMVDRTSLSQPSTVAFDPKVTSALWAAMLNLFCRVDLRGMPPFIAQWPGGLGPQPQAGALSIKLFFPYCDAICDSTADARQFERVTS